MSEIIITQKRDIEVATKLIMWADRSPFLAIMNLLKKADEWIADEGISLLTKKVLIAKADVLLIADKHYQSMIAHRHISWIIAAFMLIGKTLGLNEDDPQGDNCTEGDYIMVSDIDFENGEG